MAELTLQRQAARAHSFPLCSWERSPGTKLRWICTIGDTASKSFLNTLALLVNRLSSQLCNPVHADKMLGVELLQRHMPLVFVETEMIVSERALLLGL